MIAGLEDLTWTGCVGEREKEEGNNLITYIEPTPWTLLITCTWYFRLCN